MNSVEVDAVEGNDKAHTIKMYPVNCSYSFSQFTVSNGAAAVTRGATASPPVSGTFSIAYNGKTLGGWFYSYTCLSISLEFSYKQCM